ncbi:sigma-70 family RNA polymerase sigma factor [Algoriphagus sp.]|uniref:sigma-70 family RNA polymerase sigma factor n=1 Tax=Algoriphagus sp. TaxID=1872435 RepID=UPI003F702F14
MKCDVFNIWLENQDQLKGYISKRVRTREDVDDILQEVLIKFAKYCETKNDVKNIKGWLYKIAHNTIIDYFKDSNRIQSFNFLDIAAQDSYEGNDTAFNWLYQFLGDLPTKYSTPLKLSDLERLPHKEIAAQLGLTLEATKSRVQRARKMLKGKFEECGVIENADNQFLYTVTKPCCLS